MDKFIETETVTLDAENALLFLEWIKETMPKVLTSYIKTQNSELYKILCLFLDEKEYLLFMLGKGAYGVK